MNNEMVTSIVMIRVMKIEYWDGSKFMARLDRPDSSKVLSNIRVKMKTQFMSLSIMEQRKLARQWGQGKGRMVSRRMVNMSENEYNKSEKLKD